MPFNTLSSPDVLFFNGCWEGESKRYRVYNVAEGLNALGYQTQVLDFSQCGELIDQQLKPSVVVFFRAPFDPAKRIVEVLEYCRVNRIKTVFDIDDYVFEPTIIPQIAGVAELNEEQRASYEWGVRAYRSLLFSCEIATCTTPFLQERLKELGRDAHVVVNSVNEAQKALAERLVSQRGQAAGQSNDVVRICYFSGSKTHARDFEECAGALQALMKRHPNVMFRLVGLLELDDSWIPFAERIERAGFMPALEMLSNLAECDINIAPLEEGDLFTEGKSELKFFEAALVEVPTVASRTGPFLAAISDGETGMLASDPAEWEVKLELLITSPERRRKIGGLARTTALERFDNRVAAGQALRAYGLDVERPVLARAENSLRISWIVPGLIIGGGGHRNILRAAYFLEQAGHEVRLYFSDTELAAAQLRQMVREHFYPFEGPVHRWTGAVHGEDVLMATHWSTVSLATSVRSQVGEVMYFVQDFEPAFYPMGSEYILAENTYRQGLYAICSGPWCEHLLKRDYGMEADSFRFPVDGSIYHKAAGGDTQRAKRILFFAKPEMARRCFLIGTMALREFHRLRPDYEILFFGSGSARSHQQDYPVSYLDIVPTLQDLAKLYATSAAGLVFSTTNPSLVPYEMMACGLPVIDLGRPGNEVNYDGRSDIALLADPDPAAMARAIAELLADPASLEARRKQGLDFASTFPSEEEMAARVEALIMARMKRRAPLKLVGVGR